MDSAQGVGIEGKDADAQLIQEIVSDVLLFEQEFKDREFVGIGKDGQSMKILHQRLYTLKDTEYFYPWSDKVSVCLLTGMLWDFSRELLIRATKLRTPTRKIRTNSRIILRGLFISIKLEISIPYERRI